jgi:hypothetical protein
MGGGPDATPPVRVALEPALLVRPKLDDWINIEIHLTKRISFIHQHHDLAYYFTAGFVSIL